jgi:hypothetical protein
MKDESLEYFIRQSRGEIITRFYELVSPAVRAEPIDRAVRGGLQQTLTAEALPSLDHRVEVKGTAEIALGNDALSYKNESA